MVAASSIWDEFDRAYSPGAKGDRRSVAIGARSLGDEQFSEVFAIMKVSRTEDDISKKILSEDGPKMIRGRSEAVGLELPFLCEKDTAMAVFAPIWAE